MTNYHDKLLKYQQNQLSDEEKSAFEAELEKTEVLLDYILQQEDESLAFSSAEEESAIVETKTIKKKINQRLKKQLLLMMAIILFLFTGGFLIIPKIMAAYYYNPMTTQVTPTTGEINYFCYPNNFEFYQLVESQINLEKKPVLVDMSSTEKTGIAKYQVYLMNADDFSGEISGSQITIDKGKATNQQYFGNTNNYNLLTFQNIHLEDKKNYSKLLETINKLPDSAWLKVRVSFPEVKNFQQLQEIVEKEEEVTTLNALLDTKVEGYQEADIFGIRLYQNNQWLVNYGFSFKTLMNQQYPGLLYQQYPGSQGLIESSEEQLKEYLVAHLQYLLDHHEDSYDRLIAQEYEQEMVAKEEEIVIDFDKVDEDSIAALITELKEEELRFNKMDVAIPKAQFEEYLKEQDFSYISLLDVNLFSIGMEEMNFFGN
ncbi:hypothetical protein M2139_001084 [Enterococcus sp. PF1-24]|uniref:hypothetical protein n=1 Tax=unclassified Enterococcus TaxID=2608891 RepID=UPI002476630A|nr:MULTISPECIES: hypothetical protein [unclassified Enterococcus]MDH6364099.1 hypothetical protein [Enterococcus sp. PFB1-1]MDH6401200.1 hypothetical protein [Enterococcus sp. PF1-24]